MAGEANVSSGAVGTSQGGAAAATTGATTTNVGAGTSAASGNSAAATTPPATSTATSTPDWTSGLNEEFKGFVQTKQWKDPAQIVDSYRNLEKLLGAPQDQVLRLPKEDDADGWNNVYAKLGRPAQPADYKLEAPKEGGNPEFTKWAADRFFEVGLSTKQANTFVSKWNEYMMNATKEAQAQFQQKSQGEFESLQKEWGAAFEQNKNLASAACRQFGIDGATVEKMESVLGTAAVVKLMHNIGSKIGESKFVTGNGTSVGGALTPAQAVAERSALMADPGFVAKYAAGDHEARSKMDRLHAMMNPGEMSL